MSPEIVGRRPRPRVALIGQFSQKTLKQFGRMFPTIWSAADWDEIREIVDSREIDLVIIAPGIDWAGDWPGKVHVICFSQDIIHLPGPHPEIGINKYGSAETEEFLLPDVSLSLSRRREAELHDLSSVRGWVRLSLQYQAINSTVLKEAKDTFIKGAIICESHTNTPLAVAFQRKNNKLGVAWLPFTPIDQAAWVDVLVTEWAKTDKDRFPNVGDWTAYPEWLVPEEKAIISQIQALEKKKQDFVAKRNREIIQMNSELAIAKKNANSGRRRLLTAQGDDLKDEVANVFREIGFQVTDVDTLVGGAPRREDLRLHDSSDENEGWIALVEIRGYSRSGGTQADLQRLHRFATLYERETGQAPDKLIYVINGQLELLPSQRQEPLAPAEEDVAVFAESNGVIIWTLDLFRALRATDSATYPALVESIKLAQGRWLGARNASNEKGA